MPVRNLIDHFKRTVIIISTRVMATEMEESKLRNDMKRSQNDFSTH